MQHLNATMLAEKTGERRCVEEVERFCNMESNDSRKQDEEDLTRIEILGMSLRNGIASRYGR